MSLTVLPRSPHSPSSPLISFCPPEGISSPYSFLETPSSPQIEPFTEILQGKAGIPIDCLNKILHIASREENSIIRSACTKPQGYVSRLFSKETWEEWTDYKTDLGKVMGLFFQYLGEPVRPEDLFSSLPDFVLVNANREAENTLCLLSKEPLSQSSHPFFSLPLADAAPVEKLTQLLEEIREKIAFLNSADQSKELLLKAIGTQLKEDDTALDPDMDPEILKALSFLIKLAGTIADPSEFYNNLISGELENIIIEHLKDLEIDINKHREIPEKLEKTKALSKRLNEIKQELKGLSNEIQSAFQTEKGIEDELATLASDLADYRANLKLGSCKKLASTKTALLARIPEQKKYIETGEDFLAKALKQVSCSSFTDACLRKFSKELQEQISSFREGIPEIKEGLIHNQGQLKIVEENLESLCKRTEKDYSDSTGRLSTYLFEIKTKIATLNQKKDELEARLQATEKELRQIKEEL